MSKSTIVKITTLEDLKTLKVGDKVYWKNEKRGYNIIARDERYIIVVKMIFGKPCYSILDPQEGICSTNDYVFNPYDYSKKEEVEKSLVDLNNGEYELSERNKANILECIKKISQTKKK